MLISIGLYVLMLCAPLDWQYAEFPSLASDATSQLFFTWVVL